jgi:hypothetical protein
MKSTYNIKLKYKNSSENGLDPSKQALMGAMVKVENKKNLQIPVRNADSKSKRYTNVACKHRILSRIHSVQPLL